MFRTFFNSDKYLLLFVNVIYKKIKKACQVNIYEILFVWMKNILTFAIAFF